MKQSAWGESRKSFDACCTSDSRSDKITRENDGLLTGRRHDGDRRVYKMDTVFPESKLA